MNLQNAISLCINQLLNKFESCSLTPYLCPAGKSTIGWGTTYYPSFVAVTMNDSAITQDEADNLRDKSVAILAHQISILITSDINDNQMAACIDFAYNEGIHAFGRSNLLKMINLDPNNPMIKNEFMRWVYVDKKVCNGLKNRRNAEINLYFRC